MASDDLLGEAVEELYSADPEEFTRRRGELAARARAAGQTAVARRIAGLRKPMRSAWMINQLVRSDPGIAARLAQLGEELRAIERSGDGSRMREASQARRQLIATLVPQALARSGQHPPPAALREEITATFSAALADPEVAEQIRRATLLRPARRAGFGTAQGPALALVPPLPSGDTTQARKPDRSSADTTNAGKPRSSADTTNARKPTARPLIPPMPIPNAIAARPAPKLNQPGATPNSTGRSARNWTDGPARSWTERPAEPASRDRREG